MKTYYYLADEWMYFKIYCGVKTQEIILTEFLADSLTFGKWGDGPHQWFFVRYYDPDHHLRIRIKITNPAVRHLVFEEFNKALAPLLEQQIIWKFSLECYMPEVERYGGQNALMICHELFHDNSNLAVHLLKDNSRNQFRWLDTLLCIDLTLKAFYPEIEVRLEFLKELKDSYFKEHGSRKGHRTLINAQLREHKALISKNLYSYIQDPLWELYNLQTKNSVSKLNEIIDTDKSPNVVASLIHMACNRLLRSRQRTYEMVLYDFLYQIYFSLKMKQLTLK